MELHHQLQSLVRQRGDAVLADPDVLRAALEDYLDEQTASTGDLNLLVDAVRLGGVARLRSASQGGAVPAAAVETAGDYLARQRGSSDVASAQWACATLGYALGLVPDQVPTNLRRTMSGGVPGGYPPAGGPVMSPTPMMSPPPTSPAQQPWQSGPQGPIVSPQGQAGPPPGWSGGPGGQSPYGPQKKSKAPLIAVGAVIALLAVGGGIGWAISASGDDDDKDADGKETTSQTEEITEETDGPQLTEMEPAEIKDAVINDMNAVKSLNMAGEMVSDGEEIALDLSFDTDGRCTGSMQVQGGTASIISDGQDEYLKGDEQFWIASSGGTAPPGVLDMFVGKWMKTPGTSNFGDFCNLSNLLDEFNSGGSVDFEVQGTRVINGRDAVELGTNDGSKIYVGNNGPHHILRMINEGSEPGEFVFSQYDQPIEINVPSDYVDNPGA